MEAEGEGREAEGLESRLEELYYALPGKGRPGKGQGGAFTGFKAFWAAASRAQPPIPSLTYARAKAWFRAETLSQTHKPIRRPPLFRSYLLGLSPGVWLSCDAIYLSPIGLNRYKYLYSGIDMVSKKASVSATNSLTSGKAIEALQKFMKDLNFPNTGFNLLTDWGSDFRGKEMKIFLESRGIRHLLSSPLNKSHSSILERLHRTLRNNAMRQIRARQQANPSVREQLKTISFREAMENAVEIYNSSPNRSLGGRSPNSIGDVNVGRLLVEGEERRARQLDAYVTKASGGGQSLARVQAALPTTPRLAIGTKVRVRLTAVNPSDPNELQPSTSSFAKELERPTFSSTVGGSAQ